MALFLARPLAKAIQRAIFVGILGATVGAVTQVTLAQKIATYQYNIPATTLDRALSLFSAQSGIEFAFDPKQVKHLSSKGLNGTYSIDAGFAALLAPHGLQAQLTSKGYVIAEKSRAQVRDMGQLNRIDVATDTGNISRVAASDANVTQLPVITVSAQQNGSAEDGYLSKTITGVGVWGERSLQDTPYSMNVISGELIENSIAENMDQIFKMNPTTQATGHAVNGSGDVRGVTIRGFSSLSPIVNGISYAEHRANVPMMQDIERVEIINGATGFLYGGGRVGGAVNYITKKPTLEDLKNLSVGNFGGEAYYAHLDLGGQFDRDNVFGYRANIFYQNGESSAKIDKEQKSASLAFDYKPNDNFSTDLRYSYKDYLEKGALVQSLSTDNRKSIKKSISYSPYWVGGEAESHKIENSIRWKLNDIFTLRTNGMYEDIDHVGNSSIIIHQNGVVVPNRTFIYISPEQQTKSTGANIYLDSAFKTANIEHTLTLGYAHNFRKFYTGTWGQLRYDYEMTLDEFKHLPKPDYQRNPGSLSNKREYKNILIGDDIRFNDQWSALAGVNYATVITKNYTATPSYDASALTPTLSLIYKPLSDLTTYMTYIESLEAGTVVGSNYQNVDEVLDPYVSKQYEFGAKYSLNDRSLLTASLFRIEKANSYEIVTDALPILSQDGKQIHQGIELGITGKVMDDLTLIAGGTWMDLSIEKATNKDLEGKKPINAATTMAKIYAEYHVPTLEGFSVNGGVYYTGKRYGNNTNTDEIPAYSLFDAGLRYQTRLGQYPTTFNLNLTNLTDKVYWTSGTGLGSPRTAAFSIKTQF